jgi:hypothetical protein
MGGRAKFRMYFRIIAGRPWLDIGAGQKENRDGLRLLVICCDFASLQWRERGGMSFGVRAERAIITPTYS